MFGFGHWLPLFWPTFIAGVKVCGFIKIIQQCVQNWVGFNFLYITTSWCAYLY